MMVAHEDFLWFANNPKEFEKYKGMHVAIWKKCVLGYGKTVKEAYEMAKKNNPKAEPALAYIPEDEAMIL